MLAQDLKRLADVAEIAKLDIAPGAVTLAPTENGILAYYEGAYAAGGIIVAAGDLQKQVSVSATEFSALVALFDTNTDVILKATASELSLSTRSRRVKLRFRGDPSIEGYVRLQETARDGSVKLAPFLKEATFASTVSAVAMTAPILRGIRVVRAKTVVGIQAANGTSLVYETSIPGKSKGEKVEIAAPAEDLLLALRVLGQSEDVFFGTGPTGKTLVLSNETAVVKIATLAGQWPEMGQLRNLMFSQAISLPVPSIKALTTAARAYRSGSEATIRPGKGQTIILETEETETGQFQEVLPGLLTSTFVLDIADLDTASKMVSDAVVLEFSDQMARMTTEGRKLYLLTRVQS